MSEGGAFSMPPRLGVTGPKRTLRRGRFTIDTLPGKVFDGWTYGDFWNGWATPMFEKAEADRVAAALTRGGARARYDAQGDEYVFSDPDMDDEAFRAQIEQGRKLYPIGTYAWIWEEAD